MTARIIDGKAIAAELRAKIAAEVRALAPAASCRGWRSCWWATIRRARSMSATRARRCRKPACAPSITICRARSAKPNCSQLVRRLNGDPQVHGILVQMPLPARHRCIENHRGRRSRQGCGRLSSAQCRQAEYGPAGAGALHAARMHSARQSRARRHWRAWKRWWSAAPTSSASRSRNCCCARMRP